jgi:hypothetical protein
VAALHQLFCSVDPDRRATGSKGCRLRQLLPVFRGQFGTNGAKLGFDLPPFFRIDAGGNLGALS